MFADGKGSSSAIYFPEKSGQIPDRRAPDARRACRQTRRPPTRTTRSFVDAATRGARIVGAHVQERARLGGAGRAGRPARGGAEGRSPGKTSTMKRTDLRLDDGQKRQLARASRRRSGTSRRRSGARTRTSCSSARTASGRPSISDSSTRAPRDVDRSAHPRPSEGRQGDIEDRASARTSSSATGHPRSRSGAPSRCATRSSPRHSSRACSTPTPSRTPSRGASRTGCSAYVGKKADGSYEPFLWNSSRLAPQDVEISDDVFLIQREVAEAYSAGNDSATRRPEPPGRRSRRSRPWGRPSRLPPASPGQQNVHPDGVGGRRPAPEVDELLHEGALTVCDRAGAGVSLQVYVEPPGGVSAAEGRGDEGRASRARAQRPRGNGSRPSVIEEVSRDGPTTTADACPLVEGIATRS